MQNVVFLHKRTLYFAVASRKGCVDFSTALIPEGVRTIKSHPARDAWILATNMIQWSSISGVASRKGCVDFSSPLFAGRVGKILSHPARDAWILATYFTNVNGKITSHHARDAWILATKSRWIENKWHVAFFIKCADACHRILYRMRGF